LKYDRSEKGFSISKNSSLENAIQLFDDRQRLSGFYPKNTIVRQISSIPDMRL
jgi:hypothetical protein